MDGDNREREAGELIHMDDLPYVVRVSALVWGVTLSSREADEIADEVRPHSSGSALDVVRQALIRRGHLKAT